MFTYESLVPELLGMEILNPGKSTSFLAVCVRISGVGDTGRIQEHAFLLFGLRGQTGYENHIVSHFTNRAEKFWVYKLWSSANQFVRW